MTSPASSSMVSPASWSASAKSSQEQEPKAEPEPEPMEQEPAGAEPSRGSPAAAE